MQLVRSEELGEIHAAVEASCSAAMNTGFGDHWTVSFIFRRARPALLFTFRKLSGVRRRLRNRRPLFLFVMLAYYRRMPTRKYMRRIPRRIFSIFYITCTYAIGFAAALSNFLPLWNAIAAFFGPSGTP